MFVRDTQACNLPNSETPLDPSAIAADDAYIAAVGSQFVSGDAALSNIMQALGGNPLGSLTSGDAGVPTTGAGGFPFFPGPGAPTPYPGSLWAAGSGTGGNGGSGSGGNSNRGRPCVPPVVVPLVAVLRIPPVRRAAPGAAATPPVTPVVPQPAAAPSRKRIAQSSCSTGNICLDIRNGCVLGSQVSPEQLQACAQAGYGGNSNFYAQVDIDYGGFLGSPDPSPPPFDPSMLSNHPGLSGLGDAGSGAGMLAAGIGLMGLLWIAGKMSKKGR